MRLSPQRTKRHIGMSDSTPETMLTAKDLAAMRKNIAKEELGLAGGQGQVTLPMLGFGGVSGSRYR